MHFPVYPAIFHTRRTPPISQSVKFNLILIHIITQLPDSLPGAKMGDPCTVAQHRCLEHDIGDWLGSKMLSPTAREQHQTFETRISGQRWHRITISLYYS